MLLPLLLALTVAQTPYAPQQAPSAMLAPPLEARVQKLGKELRCAVCQGLSIADSPSSMARAQLDKVRELVSQGKTDHEVKAYFVERYGEWALLEPPAHGFNWFVWLGPVALVLVGAWVIARQLRRGPETPPEAAAEGGATTAAHETETTTTAEAEDPYLAQVRRELER